MLIDVWKVVGKHVPKSEQEAVARKLINIFENEDCDTISEVCDEIKVFDKVYREMYPGLYEDDDAN